MSTHTHVYTYTCRGRKGHRLSVNSKVSSRRGQGSKSPDPPTCTLYTVHVPFLIMCRLGSWTHGLVVGWWPWLPCMFLSVPCYHNNGCWACRVMVARFCPHLLLTTPSVCNKIYRIRGLTCTGGSSQYFSPVLWLENSSVASSMGQVLHLL